jgi:GntR family carbon starvation induced transcriptional regulator
MSAVNMSLVSEERGVPRTLAEQAYWLLRDDIVWGRLAPGQPLRSDDMRERYGLGMSPLREALTRLSSERLVSAIGQKGFTVTTVTRDDVHDTAATRLIIEREALRHSIANGDLQWEMTVVSAFHGLSRFPTFSQAEDGTGWHHYHRQFHMSLLSACGSRWQMEFAARLFDQAERQWIMRTRMSADDTLTREIQAEHQTIFDAAMARDADSAIAAMTLHCKRAADAVDRALSRDSQEPAGEE